MRSGIHMGSVLGIPLYLDFSWFFVASLLTVSAAMDARGNWLLTTLMGLANVFGLLLSVFLHELAHSWMALRLGLTLKSITLSIFGGVANLGKEPSQPQALMQVAVAGPLVSLGLFGIAIGARWLLPDQTIAAIWFSNMAWINVLIAAFNLIPGIPLDGGQILKALVWQWTGDRQRGSLWATRVGQGLGWILLLLGVYLVFLASVISGLWLSLLGLFLLGNARRYAQYDQLQGVVQQLTAQDVVRRNFRVVDAALSLREFADRYLLNRDDDAVFFAEAEGRYKGMVQPAELQGIDRTTWAEQTVLSIVTPMTELEGVSEQAPITQVAQLLQIRRRVPVLTAAGAIAGLIDKGDIIDSIGQKLGITVAPEVLAQIRERNEFPPGFPLDDSEG